MANKPLMFAGAVKRIIQGQSGDGLFFFKCCIRHNNSSHNTSTSSPHSRGWGVDVKSLAP